MLAEDKLKTRTKQSGDCILSLYSRTKGNAGYPRIEVRWRKYVTHRLAYVLAYGEFEESLRVLHRCDEPRCINPEHLFLGTQADNMQDMWNKGRLIEGMFNPNYKGKNNVH